MSFATKFKNKRYNNTPVATKFKNNTHSSN